MLINTKRERREVKNLTKKFLSDNFLPKSSNLHIWQVGKIKWAGTRLPQKCKFLFLFWTFILVLQLLVSLCQKYLTLVTNVW